MSGDAETDFDVSGPQRIDQVRAERGYTLSYHEILGRTEPDLLAIYREFYARLNLTDRQLSRVSKELIWCGLLAVAREEVASIHFERAITAGANPAQITAAVRVAASTLQQPIWDFGRDWVGEHLPANWWAEQTDGTGVHAAAGALDASDVVLVELVAHACVQNRDALERVLGRAHELGLADELIAEALTYLLLPRGVNAMLWATDVWLDTVRSGAVGSSGPLADITVETRRS